MSWRCRSACYALALVGVASLARAAGVTYSARVDGGGKAWVDVENSAGRDVEVRSVNLSFDDGDGRRLGSRTLPCKDDCLVRAGARGSFGPIEGPRGWESFHIEKLLYVDSGEGSARPAPIPPAPTPPTSSTPTTPGGRPRKPTGSVVGAASEALTCNEYCRMLASLPGCSRRSDTPACVETCREAERLVACRPIIDRFFQCVAKNPPNCVDERPAFGTCSVAETEYRSCIRE